MYLLYEIMLQKYPRVLNPGFRNRAIYGPSYGSAASRLKPSSYL